MISHKDASVWCFLFVTLFNLQGTRLIGGTFAILAHSFLFVKHFFEIFFDFFRRWLSIRFCAIEFSFAILSYRFSSVKCFLKFFSDFLSHPAYDLDIQKSALLFYHSVSRLSRTFFEIFSSFVFQVPAFRPAVSDSFVRLPRLPPFVNAFFLFFSLFAKYRKTRPKKVWSLGILQFEAVCRQTGGNPKEMARSGDRAPQRWCGVLPEEIAWMRAVYR